MELRAGYKQTEVGVIPEDWNALPVGGEIDLLIGFPFPSSGYTASGIRLLRGSNVKRGVTDWSPDITQHWPTVTNDLANYQLREGDLVIAMDGSLVGRSSAQLERADLPALLLQRVARIRSTKKLDVNYLAAFVKSDWFVKHADSVKTVTAIPHISPADIRIFTIPIPSSILEQRAIATALSDVDALLAKIDQLIAKKRDLKQAAMQQLLTGQTRLPGFSGEWEVKPMKSLGQTYGGLAGKTKEDFGHGSSKYIPFMNVMTDTVIDPNWLETVDIAQNEAQNLVKKGDLFFNGSSETPEEVGFCSVLLEDIPNLYLNSFCFGFRFNTDAKVSGLFFAYWFRGADGRAAMSVLAQGATRYNIAKSAFMRLSIPQPSQEEQTAITTVLSDMDAELAALEARRDKTRGLKQGMMQALLTGRIRLVGGN